MAKRRQVELETEPDAEIQNVEPDAAHDFVVASRVGPLEVGERAGQYLEAGERAFESDFAAESIARLVELGILEPTGGIAINVTRVQDAEEMEHGTDNSNGN